MSCMWDRVCVNRCTCAAQETELIGPDLLLYVSSHIMLTHPRSDIAKQV
jgi:succinate dehydrogenase/fumarate reductase-like Fe-S protein